MYEFFCITYRLDTDHRDSRRYWEDFAEDYSSALRALSDHAASITSSLFNNIIVLSKSEYLSVFK